MRRGAGAGSPAADGRQWQRRPAEQSPPRHGPRPPSRKDHPGQRPASPSCPTSASTLAAKTGKLKRDQGGAIYVPERETPCCARSPSSTRARSKRRVAGHLPGNHVGGHRVLENGLCIAYLGPEATNTHAAAMKIRCERRLSANSDDPGYLCFVAGKGRGRLRGSTPLKKFHRR